MTPTAGPARARIVPMDEDAARGLFHLVQRRPDAIAVPPLCTALLHDYCGTHKRECAALVNAVAEDIPAELLRGPGHVPNDVWFDGLVQRLVNNRVMSPDAADWAVTRWAEALGVRPPQTPAAAPGPPAAPPVSPGAPGAGPTEEPAPEPPQQEPLVSKPPRPPQQPTAPATRPRGVAVAVAVLAAITGLYLYFREPAPRIQAVRFFEAALDYRDRGNAPGNPAASASHFRQDETRAVWAEINLARPAPKDLTIDVVWPLPNGTPKKDSITISAGARQAVVGGYGWEEVGHWQVRTYEAEFSIAGKRVASDRFVIEPAPRDALSLKAVRFYEGGDPDPPLTQRLYKTHFWQDATRNVDFQVDLDGALQKHIDYKAKWYLADGSSFLGREHALDPNATRIEGGLKLPRWDPGSYKMDIVANGVTIASKKFTVEPPLEAQSVGFYASDPSRLSWSLPGLLAPPSETFPRGSTTYVWYKLELSRPVAEDTTIVSVWHRPDGTEASEQKTLKEGSKAVSDGRGNEQAGSLLAGAWRVDFFLDNKKIATKGFVVTEAPKLPVLPSKPQPRQSGGGTSGLPKTLQPCPPGQHPVDFLGTRVCVKNP